MSQSPQQAFLAVIQHVMGQALDAAAYQLEDNPLQHNRGFFRFWKSLESGAFAFIEFQMLYHDQSGLSRFRVNLVGNSVRAAAQATPDRREKTLAAVIWHDFNAPHVLPSDDHWWLYKHPQDLAPQVLEMGKLLFGYGIPWLENP